MLQFLDCPPRERTASELVAFRFVHKDKMDGRNFLPAALIPGARPPGTAACCTDYSLSFFATQDKAIERLRVLCMRQPQFKNRSGGCLATVSLGVDDGESTPPSPKTSHFEFFEYQGVDLHPKIVGDLLEVVE